MAALDRIRLTGLLRKAPLRRGFLVLAEGLEPIDSVARVAAPEIRHPLFARFFDRLSKAMEPEVGPRRDELLAGLAGRVLEVGAGNGINFPHYPASVDEVVALEPEPYLRARAERAAGDFAGPGDGQRGRGRGAPVSRRELRRRRGVSGAVLRARPSRARWRSCGGS